MRGLSFTFRWLGDDFAMILRSCLALLFALAALLAPLGGVSAAGIDDAGYLSVLPGGDSDIHRRNFSVGKEKSADGRPWIVMRAEYEAAMRADSREILAILRDYHDAPAIFPRIERVDVLDDQGDKALTRQTTVFRVLGMTIANTLEFQVIYKHVSPSMTVQLFSMIKSDGSALKNKGSWMVEEVLPASAAQKGPLCRVVYELETWSEPRYPLQEFVMRNFGPGDIMALFKQLAGAIQRNRAQRF